MRKQTDTPPRTGDVYRITFERSLYEDGFDEGFLRGREETRRLKQQRSQALRGGGICVVLPNVRHTITGPIGKRMEPYGDGIRTAVTNEPVGIELARCGHEFIVSIVLEHDFDFYAASDPENEDGPFRILEIIGLNGLEMILLCQEAHKAALSAYVEGAE